MKNCDSQNLTILNHLLTSAPITSIEAFNFFGCTRLAARIDDLKNKGFQIKTELIPIGQTRYAKYSMV